MSNVTIGYRATFRKYLASVSLAMTILASASVSQTASAKQDLGGTISSSTVPINQAQADLQNSRVQQIHIAVIGEVKVPGAYFLQDSAPLNKRFTQSKSLPTVTRAIQAAGGITHHADVRRVQIRRQAPNGSKQVIDVDLYKYLSKEDLSQDIRLQNGDVVVIPFVKK